METTVKIKAIQMLSSMVGRKSKIGKISNCIKIAKINPLPTSMRLSIKLLISLVDLCYCNFICTW